MLWCDCRLSRLQHLRCGELTLANALFAEPCPDLGTVARRDEVALFGYEPVPAGGVLLARNDFDNLAVGERVGQRHDPAVDFGATAAMA